MQLLSSLRNSLHIAAESVRCKKHIYIYVHIYLIIFDPHTLTLTLPGPSAGVSGSLDSYCSLKPLCSGMGEVVPARTSATLLPPPPRTVLSLSCFKVLQCINCRDWHCKSYRKLSILEPGQGTQHIFLLSKSSRVVESSCNKLINFMTAASV